MSHISDTLVDKQSHLFANPGSSSKKNIFNVTKRTGEIVLFEESKVRRSITIALNAAGVEDNPISNQLVDEVIKKLADELRYKDSISTLDIREAVEIAFLERGLTNAAQQYHDYPETKQARSQQPAQPESSQTKKMKQEPAAQDDALLTVKDFMEFHAAATKDVPFKGFGGVLKKQATQQSSDQAVQAVELPVRLPIVQKPKKQALGDSLENDRNARVHVFAVDGHSGRIVVSLFADARPAEVVVYGLEAMESTKSLVDMFTSMLSVALQHNVPMHSLLRGVDGQMTLPIALNKARDTQAWTIIEYICSYLESTFAPGA